MTEKNFTEPWARDKDGKIGRYENGIPYGYINMHMSAIKIEGHAANTEAEMSRLLDMIAAVPELIEACEMAYKAAFDPDYDEYFDGTEIADTLLAVIKKAKGGKFLAMHE